MMKRPIQLTEALCAVCLLLAPGCGRSSSDNVTAPDGKNYRQRLNQIREKRKAEQDLAMLQNAVRTFQSQHAKLPENLGELVKRKLIAQVPPAPPGFYFAYDNVLGNVTLRRIPAGALEQQNRAPASQPL